MRMSDSIAALAKALSAAQSEIKGARKDSENPFFRSKYADLASVWDACREPLTKNGLSVIQTTEPEPAHGNDLDAPNHSVLIETMLAHESGEWIAGSLKVTPVKDDPQGLGSAITYGRRYALAAIVGVAPEDDDGNAASQPGAARQPAKTTDAALRGELLKQAEKLAKLAGYSDAKVKIAIGRLAKKSATEMQRAIDELKAKIDEEKPKDASASEADKAKESTRIAIRKLFEKHKWDDAAIKMYLGDKALETASLDQLIAWHDELEGDGPAF